MAYVLYTPLASPSLPLLDPLTSPASSLSPSHLPPYQTHYILAMQPSSPYAATDFTQHLPPQHHQYVGKEYAGIHSHLAYSASSSSLVPLLHAPLADYTAGPPPSSRVTECKDWLKGRCMRGIACRFLHSNLTAASSVSALTSPFTPASPYIPASPLPVATHSAAALSPFLSNPSPHSMVGALSPTPLHYGAAAAAYTGFPSAASAAGSFASFGSGGLSSFPSFPCYLPYPSSPNAAMGSYTPQTPSYPLSPSYSTASFPSVASLSTVGSGGGGGGGVSHPSPSSASSVQSSSPSSTSGSSIGSLPAVSEPCRDFQHGVCFRGASCRFVHEKQLCGDWLNQKCARGATCKFSHDKRGGPLCRDWLQGRCTRGEECRYHHSDEPQEQAASTAGAVAGECRDWIKGRCLRGAACKFAHSAASPLTLGVSAADIDGVHEQGRKRNREQPSASSPPAHTLPIVNVTLDPALQSAFNKPLQITMTQQADTGVVHITLTNGQQQPHDDSALLEQQQQQRTERQRSYSHSGARQPQPDGAVAGRDTADEEDSRRKAAGRLQQEQPSEQRPGGDKADSASGEVDEQIDQTDGAADGDVYLADERPAKRQRRRTADDEP